MHSVAGEKSPHITNTNFIIDFALNVVSPTQDSSKIIQTNGTFSSRLSQSGKDKIYKDLKECVEASNPSHVSTATTLNYITFGLCFLTFLIPAIIIMSSFMSFRSVNSYEAASNIFSQKSKLMAISFGVVCVGIIGICLLQIGKQQISQKWQNELLDELKVRMSGWHEMNPQFSYTIIYPVQIIKYYYNRRNGHRRSRVVAIWLNIRVTEGPCSAGPNEPIYTTLAGSAVAPTQSHRVVYVQQPQPQHAQNVVYVQHPNTQQMQPQVVVMEQSPPPQYDETTAMTNQ